MHLFDRCSIEELRDMEEFIVELRREGGVRSLMIAGHNRAFNRLIFFN